ncbi:Endonuclease/Exonuclease/phosphatase family protein [Trichomonas vaginalis G3]|uniref:Endonuclease/Exonuclease/phosphatase family protein n=1 Tax=Trichomonas vaginalis (strain ATCC PRA-98 / G3) TaxID=412133 RepID=A2DRU8_TRIV3|nr:phosphatidylinositol-4,5-bisphosphate 5-phosphatase protein [Trichomonas vaginalis G3]EAY16895.1 Endonuclease/Exonuclease/phosphatase family protein [Trichomonas vaginalis G3]KAI5489118.1 phosphatidylinositol-4,5-bisphosphate 5-phosphatase protein [Trichomonas vaginalis G3]|eukprot:XP_001329118.1 Endonuclease/Exonuclease/phosphatase family protein [Trichomonas vaginalis G3]
MSSRNNNSTFMKRSGSAQALKENQYISDVLRDQVTTNCPNITHFQDVNVSVITWNVASVKPHPMVIEEIRQSFKCGDKPADVIFIALQEIDMGIVSIMVGSTEVSNKWSKIIGEAVSQEQGRYMVISERTLGGVYAAVIVRIEAKPKLDVHHVKTIRLGVYGMAANKGAAIFYCTMSCARFVVIACHLSPHTENLQQRNEQVRQLLKTVQGAYDYLIFVGDLNYRITLSYEETCKLIEQGNIERLLEFDQLRNSMKSDRLIGALKEPPLVFVPTYKFDKNCDVYDTSSKHRVPSWTDRILIKRGPRRLAVDKSKEKNFPKMPKIIAFRKGVCMFSDHRSVTASYIFKVPVIDYAKVEKIKNGVIEEFEEKKAESSAGGFVKLEEVPSSSMAKSEDTFDPFADIDAPPMIPATPVKVSNPGTSEVDFFGFNTAPQAQTKPIFDPFGFNSAPQNTTPSQADDDKPLIIFDFIDAPPAQEKKEDQQQQAPAQPKKDDLLNLF